MLYHLRSFKFINLAFSLVDTSQSETPPTLLFTHITLLGCSFHIPTSSPSLPPFLLPLYEHIHWGVGVVLQIAQCISFLVAVLGEAVRMLGDHL